MVDHRDLVRGAGVPANAALSDARFEMCMDEVAAALGGHLMRKAPSSIY